MKKRKILYISGTRADYGLMRKTLFAIKKHPKLDIEIVVSGMHLMLEFGKTINEIKKDPFRTHVIKATYQNDDKESMVNFIGKFILGLLKKIKKIKPNIIFVQGDRLEMLGGAMAGVYLGIPVVHTHGGDATSTVDEVVRHAITKLSHLHLPVTKKSAQRIIKMGEDRWRVKVVGAPGLDSILAGKLLSRTEIAKKYKLSLTKPILLVIQHPTTEAVEAASQMKETMEAVKELSSQINSQTIIVYPNADPGGRKMIGVIERYRKYPFIKIYRNIPRLDYLSLMKIAKAIIGNSSSGIVEAPSFKLAAVNIGEREEGRERAGNVINVDYNKKQIIKAIKKAIFDKKFREKLKRCRNLYGGGKTGVRIAKILSKIKIDKKLLNKKISY